MAKVDPVQFKDLGPMMEKVLTANGVDEEAAVAMADKVAREFLETLIRSVKLRKRIMLYKFIRGGIHPKYTSKLTLRLFNPETEVKDDDGIRKFYPEDHVD